MVEATINSTTLTTGSLAAFRCMASGFPLPKVSWMHNGVELKSIDIRQNYETKYPGLNDNNEFGGTVRLLLNVPFISEVDAGQYVCIAENEHGKTSQGIKLDIKSKGNPAMVITDAPGSIVTISESDNLKHVIIPCVGVGEPKPKMSWDVLGRHKSIRSNHYPVAKGLKAVSYTHLTLPTNA